MCWFSKILYHDQKRIQKPVKHLMTGFCLKGFWVRLFSRKKERVYRFFQPLFSFQKRSILDVWQGKQNSDAILFLLIFSAKRLLDNFAAEDQVGVTGILLLSFLVLVPVLNNWLAIKPGKYRSLYLMRFQSAALQFCDQCTPRHLDNWPFAEISSAYVKEALIWRSSVRFSYIRARYILWWGDFSTILIELLRTMSSDVALF